MKSDDQPPSRAQRSSPPTAANHADADREGHGTAKIHGVLLCALATPLIVSLTLTGCADSNAALIASHPDKIAVGAKPQGYPKTYIDHVNGYCEQVTEFWRDGGMKTNGRTTWFKVVDRVTTSCPR